MHSSIQKIIFVFFVCFIDSASYGTSTELYQTIGCFSSQRVDGSCNNRREHSRLTFDSSRILNMTITIVHHYHRRFSPVRSTTRTRTSDEQFLIHIHVHSDLNMFAFPSASNLLAYSSADNRTNKSHRDVMNMDNETVTGKTNRSFVDECQWDMFVSRSTINSKQSTGTSLSFDIG
jgi:hypothetical protein